MPASERIVELGFMGSASLVGLSQCDDGSVASVVGVRKIGRVELPFGIDFGGSGIKGAPVDLEAGDFAGERVRIKTPQPSTPEAVAQVFTELLDQFPSSKGAVGVTVPAVVRHGVVSSAANIDRGWIGTDADALFTEATGRDVHVVNDADAAGLAEVRFGAAKGRRGLVIVTTLGTGIGSAIVYDGVLVPNSELGHLEIDGHDAEKRAASSIKEDEGLSYPEWAKRLTVYYRTLEKLFSPDLFVVGGGVSKDSAEFLHLIDIETEIVAAKLQNRAGIVGAALWAFEAGDERP
jgi:polyphosphate glucokinase